MPVILYVDGVRTPVNGSYYVHSEVPDKKHGLSVNT